MSNATSDWTSTIEEVRDSLGLSACQYPTPVLLAFIDVESDGDPSAHRPGSAFRGLLQMGPPAGKDVGIDVTDLEGDGELAIHAFLELQERYADRHDYDPIRMAVVWKGGAGTAKTVDRRMEAGVDRRRAIIYAEAKHSIPNLQKYIARFKAALRRWGA